MKFTGNRALILGGNCDLAITLARHMIEAGLFPLLTYRNEKGLEYISNNLKDSPKRYSSFYLEFGNRDSIDSLLHQTGDDIDFMVDFAQGNFESLVASADVDRIYSYFAENVSFRAEVVKRVARIMLKNKEAVLFIFLHQRQQDPIMARDFMQRQSLHLKPFIKIWVWNLVGKVLQL